MEKINLVGALTAQAIFLLSILVFVARLLGRPSVSHWIGILLLLTAIPLVYLLYTAFRLDRSALYFIQVGLMLAYLLAELVLDYVLTIEFRQIRWMLISYVTLFFAGTGGMIGIAAEAGKSWTVSSVILFLIMAVVAFIQRAKTGI